MRILREEHTEDKWVFVISPPEYFDLSKQRINFDTDRKIEGSITAPLKEFPDERFWYAEWFSKSWNYESARRYAEIAAKNLLERVNVEKFLQMLRKEQEQRKTA